MNRPGSHLQALAALFLVQLFTTLAFAQMPDLSPLPGTGSLANPEDPKKFTFVLAGDNRPAKSSCQQPPEPAMIFDAVKAMNPQAAFVLWTGDTISGKEVDESVLKPQYEEFLKLAAQAGVPVFNAPGNHEMDNAKNVPKEEMKEFYRTYMAKPYGAFTYGNSRFIALDSENEPKSRKNGQLTMAEGEAKSEAPGSITAKQLGLLKDDLEADKKLDHVFIFMHHPVIPYDDKDGLDPDSTAALESLFAKYKNISYVVSGHEHMYYYGGDGKHPGDKTKMTRPPSRTDPSQPPYYLVSGGGGAPLVNDTPGSFFHYLIFRVDGEKITPELVQIGSCVSCGGKKPDKCDPCTKQKQNKCSSLKLTPLH